MSVLENFKNIPRSPYGGATELKCNFFLQIYNEVPGEKKEGACRPLGGDRVPISLCHLSLKIQKKREG